MDYSELDQEEELLWMEKGYSRGYNDAVKEIKQLINEHGYATYGEEGAKISALLCMVIDKIGGVEREEGN